jgi:hypothetical protein
MNIHNANIRHYIVVRTISFHKKVLKTTEEFPPVYIS